MNRCHYDFGVRKNVPKWKQPNIVEEVGFVKILLGRVLVNGDSSRPCNWWACSMCLNRGHRPFVQPNQIRLPGGTDEKGDTATSVLDEAHESSAAELLVDHTLVAVVAVGSKRAATRGCTWKHLA